MKNIEHEIKRIITANAAYVGVLIKHKGHTLTRIEYIDNRIDRKAYAKAVHKTVDNLTKIKKNEHLESIAGGISELHVNNILFSLIHPLHQNATLDADRNHTEVEIVKSSDPRRWYAKDTLYQRYTVYDQNETEYIVAVPKNETNETYIKTVLKKDVKRLAPITRNPKVASGREIQEKTRKEKLEERSAFHTKKEIEYYETLNKDAPVSISFINQKEQNHEAK